MNESTPLRVAIYVRQSVRDDQGIVQQIAECKRRVKGEGWQLVDVYNDNKTSASKVRGAKTAWARMLADIDAGRVQAVVSVKAARLLRRVEDVLEITRRNVRVVTTGDGIDTASAFGKAILTIIVALAENEIEEKEGRARPYRAARREAGHPTAGRVPFGYAWVPKLNRDEAGTRYVIVPEEAAVIRYMSTELLAGAKLGAIVRDLNDSGELTRDKKPWTTTTARRLLLSPFHAGLLTPPVPEGEHYDATKIDMSKCTKGTWTAILTVDAVQAARHLLLDPSRRKHDGETRAKWMLAGLGQCGKCAGSLRSCQTKTTAQSERAYRCVKGCFQRPAAYIEHYVSKAVIALLSAPGLLQWMPDEGVDIEALRTRRSALIAGREEAERLWEEEQISGDALRRRNAKIAPQIEKVDAALTAALQSDPLVEIVTADDVRAMWERISTARKRTILAALAFRIDVHPVGKGRRVVSVEDTEGTVRVGWKRAEHRVSLTVARSMSSLPRVPDDAREIVSAALNA